jgi:hypothetical protein
MYLRHTTRRKDSQVHRYWRLVRSVRVGRTVVRQTVAHLGELDAAGCARARALPRVISGEREPPELFGPNEPDEPIAVRLEGLRLERRERRWRRCLRWRGCASRRVSCTSARRGTAAPRWKISSRCPRRWCTTTGSIAPSIGSSSTQETLQQHLVARLGELFDRLGLELPERLRIRLPVLAHASV